MRFGLSVLSRRAGRTLHGRAAIARYLGHKGARSYAALRVNELMRRCAVRCGNERDVHSGTTNACMHAMSLGVPHVRTCKARCIDLTRNHLSYAESVQIRVLKEFSSAEVAEYRRKHKAWVDKCDRT